MPVQFVDIAEAGKTLPALVTSLEKRQVREIVICRAGRPVAKLMSVEPARIGVAKGKFEVLDHTDTSNSEIATLFRDESPS